MQEGNDGISDFQQSFAAGIRLGLGDGLRKIEVPLRFFGSDTFSDLSAVHDDTSAYVQKNGVHDATSPHFIGADESVVLEGLYSRGVDQKQICLEAGSGLAQIGYSLLLRNEERRYEANLG